MWNAYRTNYDCVWTPDYPNNPYSNGHEINCHGMPLLIFTFAGTNSVVISWPSPSTGYVLQQNPDLTTTNWSTCGTATDDGVIKSITNSLSAGHIFFRLKQQ
jgi:hypothetical protein